MPFSIPHEGGGSYLPSELDEKLSAKAKLTLMRMMIADPAKSESYPVLDTNASRNGVYVFHSADNKTEFVISHGDNNELSLKQFKSEAFKGSYKEPALPGTSAGGEFTLKSDDDGITFKPKLDPSDITLEKASMAVYHGEAVHAQIDNQGSALVTTFEGSLLQGSASLGLDVEKEFGAKVGLDIAKVGGSVSYMTEPEIGISRTNSDQFSINQFTYGVKAEAGAGGSVGFNSVEDFKKGEENVKLTLGAEAAPSFNYFGGDESRDFSTILSDKDRLLLQHQGIRDELSGKSARDLADALMLADLNERPSPVDPQQFALTDEQRANLELRQQEITSRLTTVYQVNPDTFINNKPEQTATADTDELPKMADTDLIPDSLGGQESTVDPSVLYRGFEEAYTRPSSPDIEKINSEAGGDDSNSTETTPAITGTPDDVDSGIDSGITNAPESDVPTDVFAGYNATNSNDVVTGLEPLVTEEPSSTVFLPIDEGYVSGGETTGRDLAGGQSSDEAPGIVDYPATKSDDVPVVGTAPESAQTSASGSTSEDIALTNDLADSTADSLISGPVGTATDEVGIAPITAGSYLGDNLDNYVSDNRTDGMSDNGGAEANETDSHEIETPESDTGSGIIENSSATSPEASSGARVEIIEVPISLNSIAASNYNERGNEEEAASSETETTPESDVNNERSDIAPEELPDSTSDNEASDNAVEDSNNSDSGVDSNPEGDDDSGNAIINENEGLSDSEPNDGDLSDDTTGESNSDSVIDGENGNTEIGGDPGESDTGESDSGDLSEGDTNGGEVGGDPGGDLGGDEIGGDPGGNDYSDGGDSGSDMSSSDSGGDSGGDYTSADSGGDSGGDYSGGDSGGGDSGGDSGGGDETY